jgi:hypothetical protein
MISIKESFLKMLKTRERGEFLSDGGHYILKTVFPIFEYLEVSLTSFSAF